MQVYDVKKLRFQANFCEGFTEEKKQRYCRDLVFRMGSFV